MDHEHLALAHTHRDILIRLNHTHHTTLPALTLRTYLPTYPPRLSRRTHTLDLDAYLATSTPTRHGLVRPTKAARILAELLDILATAPHSPHHQTDPAAPLLTDALARAQLMDRRCAPGGRGGTAFPRTLAAFVVLADVSRAFGSRRIGAVLASFFVAHCGGERVLGCCGGAAGAGGGGEQAVLLWAWAVTVARMREGERAACLGAMVRARPDVLARKGFAGWAAAVVPDGEGVGEAVGRAVDREGLGIGIGWKRGGEEWEQGERDGGVYLHERRERRVVRGAGGGGRPLDLETYHRARRLGDLEDLVPWKGAGPPGVYPGYGGGVGGGGGGGGGGSGVRGTLDSIRNDQRELRFDMHDVRDELDELAQQIDELGRRDRDVGRRGRAAWRDRDVIDSSERWPEEYESEWVSEWWDDYY